MNKSDIKTGFECSGCGVWHTYPAYVFAHMRDVLEFKCDCGAKYKIILASARRTNPKHKCKEPVSVPDSEGDE